MVNSIFPHLPTFLPDTAPVELISSLDSYQQIPSGVLLSCGADRYHLTRAEYYGTTCETTFQEPSSADPLNVRIHFCTEDIVRITSFRGHFDFDQQSAMLVENRFSTVDTQVIEKEKSLEILSSVLRLVIQRQPWQIQIYNQENDLIFNTRPVDIAPLQRPEIQWSPPQQRWLFLHRYAYPWGIRPGDHPCVFASFSLHHQENIYGLGEDFGPVDKRGVQRQLWLQEGFGNASPAAYKQTPFYMSSRGYGLFIHSSNSIHFRIGELDHTAISCTVRDTNALDLFWMYGPTLKEILPKYTLLTGTPGIPPPWSFGLWMGRITYDRQDQVENVAKELRQRKIPCDVIHIDTGWYEEDWECDYQFGKEKFPDPEKMFNTLKSMGFRASLWQWPNLKKGTPIFEEAAEKGYLVRTEENDPYIYSGFLSETGLIDFSNPGAVRWMEEKLNPLFKLGASAIKVDFGEGAPPNALYHGLPGTAMHNLYPLLYSHAIHQITKKFQGEEETVLWARAGWAGSQRYPVHWSGDGIARFEDLACVLRSALSMGLSGFPFYSHDVGGFSGFPSPELYVRWAQFGFFSSHVRCHGEPPREPWAYGEEANHIFRQYAELRYRLLPYLVSEAQTCGQTSLPMIRALLLEFPDDPITRTIFDQYMFGSAFLVAPILEKTSRRTVYLPTGKWVDFWTKQQWHGPIWKTVEAPLDKIPLFIRGRSIIPYGPLCQYVQEKPLDPLTVEIYCPEGNHHYQVYYDGAKDISIRYQRSENILNLMIDRAPGAVEILLFGVTVISATKMNKNLSVEPLTFEGWKILVPKAAHSKIEIQLL